ncbi:MAG: glutamate--tRNA ligase [Rhodospirillales bacterium]
MTVKVRFAPSPTGLLHIGNARMALLNWLFAAKHRGQFILRLDDTDAARSKAEYAEAIERDLLWLGLTWDDKAYQSGRLARYEAAFETLRGAGRLYPCFETQEELEYKRKRQLARGHPPVYDRAGLSVSDADRAAFEAEGCKPHWRFLLDHAEIAWDDLARGPVRFEGENLSDPVVRREDGSWLYMLPSVVDDVDMGITHVIRGEDHVANTAVQAQMFQALGAPAAAFAHLPLLTDAAGQGLSKRAGSITLQSMREAGIEAIALNNFLAQLGSGETETILYSLNDLAEAFDIAGYGRAAPKFDRHQLESLNSRVLHDMPFDRVRDRLAEMGLDDIDEHFWRAVRANLDRLGDIADWHAVCFAALETPVDDAAFIARAAALLPPEPWDEGTWKAWTQVLGKETGRKGKDLFLPLRRTLTGRDHGPELKTLLPLMGRMRVLERLRAS